jgi:hypothetical protein
MSEEIGTGSRPTMGTEAANLSRVGKAERGRLRPKGGAGKNGNALQGPTGHRKASFEKMGATLHPTATLYAQNAAEASEICKRVVMMPSRNSWTDSFRAKAKYGRTM